MGSSGHDTARLSSGIAGLDVVLDGGFLPSRSYMVRGEPGVGKTALGLHFLAAGAAAGEHVLFLTQGASVDALRQDGASIGISADGIDFVDFTPSPAVFAEGGAYDIFSPDDVERDSYTARIVGEIERIRPRRVFLDALTHGRHLSTNLVEFRRQAHAFLRFLVESGATVLFASGSSDPQSDEDLQFMSDGVLHLRYSQEAGSRILSVTKMRGSRFRLGQHSVKITDSGVQLFPRLVPEAHAREFPPEQIASGLAELDVLLGGGIERGTLTLVTGPTGVGKTTFSLQLVKEAAARGERSVVYSFEEAKTTLRARAEAVGIPLGEMEAAGTLSVIEAEPLNYTPDEFALAVREEIERRGARIVILDSIAGYRLAIQGEDLVAHIHALCRYLKNMGATVIAVYETSSVTGEFRATDVGISYLTDNIVFLRYIELDGELRRVVGVLKKRMSDFEKTLRELSITSRGIEIGRPLKGLRGILRGIPEQSAADRG